MSATLVQRVLMYLLAFVIAITLHEFAHALSADLLGDDGPKRAGRISLNPLDHLDPMGTLFLVVTAVLGYAFGWGRPVMVSSSRFKNPRVGDAIVSFAGPATNLILAIVCAVIVRTGYFRLPNSSPWHEFIDVALNLNILLFVFNLVPVPPLDGSHILADILPIDMAKSYQGFMARYGFIMFFVIIYFGGMIVGPAMNQIHSFLVPGS